MRGVLVRFHLPRKEFFKFYLWLRVVIFIVRNSDQVSFGEKIFFKTYENVQYSYEMTEKDDKFRTNEILDEQNESIKPCVY